MQFPTIRPERANYMRPREGEVLALSPPGFCWWRAGDRGACQYRVVVEREGRAYYESALLADPIHLPERVFEPGAYDWHVQAVVNGAVRARSSDRSFAIAEGAAEQAWTDPAALLANVPAERPRLFFLASHLKDVRRSLTSTRAEAYEVLRRDADRALTLEPPVEPTYDQIEDPAERRLAYTACFGTMRKYHDGGMRSLALCYLLSGETPYGEAARRLLVDAAQWDPEGISSILAPYGDEVGLGLLRAGAEVYDWIFDLLTEAERRSVEEMLGARADQMIRRLEKSDYTFTPEESHNGRLPGFLLEHAIARAEDPRAVSWAEYALKIIATNFPHWAGYEGGWAQGVPYGMSYNSRDAMPFHAWKLATGHDIWRKPYYQNMPWFFYYAVSPMGEIMPFGDTEDAPVRASQARTFLQFHGLRLQNARLRAWADQVRDQDGRAAEIDPFPGILLEDAPMPPAEDAVPQDRAFRGVGWAALHSDIAQPTEDLMVVLRASPFGGVSHGHASQNDFAVMKGGRALICAGGLRFPHHGTPFHNEYCQQSMSHNCVLVDGEGAINRDGNRGGEIIGFETTDRFGYVCGEAENAYGDRLNRYRRHIALIRPGVFVLVDELEAPESATFQWLLHAFEKFDLDVDAATVTSNRKGAALTARLFASTALRLSQTDAWPVPPDKGYPTLDRELPPKRWHLTAETEKVARCRIAAVCAVQGPNERAPDFSLTVSDGRIALSVGDATAEIDLSADERAVLALSAGSDALTIQA